MQLTERAQQYMRKHSNDGLDKIFYLFASETCCGAGVGMKTQPKKEGVQYIEVDGLSFKFEPAMLMALHGMVIDIITQPDGIETIQIITKSTF